MKYILCIDQSTSGTKVGALNELGQLSHIERKKHAQYYPAPGWVEHDAEEIWNNVSELLRKVASQLVPSDVVGLAITNQRETTVLWDRATGIPVHPAIVWQDVRAAALTDRLQQHDPFVRQTTGLQLSPYYSAAKAAAVLTEHPELMERARKGELCLGTIDSYLLYRLTEGRSFKAEVSNASRTQLMELSTLSWSSKIAALFDLPMSLLPDEICMSDADFGSVTAIDELNGVPVLAMLGDSHASLYGHGCVNPGMIKVTYGTGSSIMMNVGTVPHIPSSGLSASVAFGIEGKVSYVLEGNITCSADTLMWLKDDLHLISSMDDLDEAATVASSEGVYLVPAFAGLGAPWFDEKARALLFGMNRGTKRAHILRAALNSIAHQIADVMDAMSEESGCPITLLEADGGGSVNTLLMQTQSDLIPCKVAVSDEPELSLLGAGLLAARHAGILSPAFSSSSPMVYVPQLDESSRQLCRAGWHDALKRCR